MMRNKFRLMVHEADGQQFQDLFTKIMQYSDSEFKPVKPHGSLGDKGNDGWNSRDGKYYQVYAPEDLAKDIKKAENKARNDLKKLIDFWNSISPIREYFFVVNDKYKGVSISLNKVVSDLRDEYQLQKTEIITPANLESMLFALSDDQIASVIGFSDRQENDKVKVRKYLDSLSSAIRELLCSGREVGYFFP